MILTWQQIASPIITEIMTSARGSEGIVLDNEHGVFTRESLFSCIQAANINRKKVFVRLGDIRKADILFCLDAGVDGLIFSTVESRQQAKKINDYALFPKDGGRRGTGLVRQNGWGTSDFIQKKRKPILIAQIETALGSGRVGEFSELFDYFMIGPYDMSSSLGAPGNFNTKLYKETVANVEQIVGKTKMAVHIPSDIASNISLYEGYGIKALGMDTTLLIEGLEGALKQVVVWDELPTGGY